MADQSGINERQRELFIRKSTRVAAAYLKRAKELCLYVCVPGVIRHILSGMIIFPVMPALW